MLIRYSEPGFEESHKKLRREKQMMEKIIRMLTQFSAVRSELKDPLQIAEQLRRSLVETDNELLLFQQNLDDFENRMLKQLEEAVSESDAVSLF